MSLYHRVGLSFREIGTVMIQAIKTFFLACFSICTGFISGGKAPITQVAQGMALVVQADGRVAVSKLDLLRYAVSDLLLNKTLDSLHHAQMLATEAVTEVTAVREHVALKTDRVHTASARNALALCIVHLKKLVIMCTAGEDQFRERTEIASQIDRKMATTVYRNRQAVIALYQNLIHGLGKIRGDLQGQLMASEKVIAQ